MSQVLLVCFIIGLKFFLVSKNCCENPTSPGKLFCEFSGKYPTYIYMLELILCFPFVEFEVSFINLRFVIVNAFAKGFTRNHCADQSGLQLHDKGCQLEYCCLVRTPTVTNQT